MKLQFTLCKATKMKQKKKKLVQTFLGWNLSDVS